MLKNWRKMVLLMILSVFLLLTGCGRGGREIVPATETGGSLGTAENAEDMEDAENADISELKRSEKADPKGYPAEGEETTVSEPESLCSGEMDSEDTSGDVQNLHHEKMVVVHVCGAVNSPGIYSLPEGSRLWEAVEAAGGVRPDGAGDYLNMAVPVTDGEKVVVPFLADVEKPFGEAETLSPRPGADPTGTGSAAGNGGGTGDSGTPAGQVNLNTATMEQLMTLPGIGESKARAILEYRENTGPFTVPRDITNVPGIKEGSYEKLKDYITV